MLKWFFNLNNRKFLCNLLTDVKLEDEKQSYEWLTFSHISIKKSYLTHGT